MSFVESPRFPDTIALGAEGGPEWLTQIVAQISGFEQRNAAWPVPRRRYNVTLLNRDIEEIREIASFMMITEGRANGFRFKDFFDFDVPDTSGGTGLLGTGIGTGEPTYQLVKRYISGDANHDRDITKPVVGQVAVERGGYPATVGGSPLLPGQIEIDYTTGIVEFGADDSDSVIQVNVGATTAVQLATAIGLVVGQKLYLSGLNGTAGTTLNGAAWTVLSIGSPENTYIVEAATTGLTWTGGGTGFRYPQASETLTWSGEFDVPVRFEVDRMRATVTVGGQPDDRRATWDSIEIVEIRL